MPTIAVVNQKGGSGKTTTVINLGAALALEGAKVLVVDLDPQGSASSWLGCEETESDRGIWDVLVNQKSLRSVVEPTPVKGVELARFSSFLVGLDVALASQPGKGTRLRDAISDLTDPGWDYILVDCPPTLGMATINALAAAERALVTVEAHVLALRGVAQLWQTLETVRERLNPSLGIAGILICRFDARTRHAKEIRASLVERFGNLVLPTVIRENVRLAECPSFHQSIHQYAPRCTGSEDYRKLAEQLAQKD